MNFAEGEACIVDALNIKCVRQKSAYYPQLEFLKIRKMSRLDKLGQMIALQHRPIPNKIFTICSQISLKFHNFILVQQF